LGFRYRDIQLKNRGFSKQIRVLGLLISILIIDSIPLDARVNQERIDTFYLQLYNYRFLSADSSLQQIISTENEQGMIDLLRITYQWWTIISGGNPASIDALQKYIDRAIDRIEKVNSANHLTQEKLLQLIVMYSYKSRAHNLQHNRLSGYSAFNTSLDYFEKIKSRGESVG